MLMDNEELVFLTPPPKLVDNDVPSKKPLSRSTSKQDKLSLSKVSFFFLQVIIILVINYIILFCISTDFFLYFFV